MVGRDAFNLAHPLHPRRETRIRCHRDSHRTRSRHITDRGEIGDAHRAAEKFAVSKFRFEPRQQMRELVACGRYHCGRLCCVLARGGDPESIADRVESAIAQIFDCAHPRALVRMRREQRRRRKRFFQVLADDRRIGNRASLAEIERGNFGPRRGRPQVIFSIQRVASLDGLEIDLLHLQHHPNLARIRAGGECEQLYRHRRTSLSETATARDVFAT